MGYHTQSALPLLEGVGSHSVLTVAGLVRSLIRAHTLSHVCIQSNPCSVYGWGANDFGQLAQAPAAAVAGSASTGATRLSNHKSGCRGGMFDDSSAVELRLPPKLFARCATTLSLTKLLLISTSFVHQLNRSVACGDCHTLLVTTAGTMFGTGAMMAGQLGIKKCNVKTMISKALTTSISTSGESLLNGFGSLHQTPLEHGGMLSNRGRNTVLFETVSSPPSP